MHRNRVRWRSDVAGYRWTHRKGEPKRGAEEATNRWAGHGPHFYHRRETDSQLKAHPWPEPLDWPLFAQGRTVAGAKLRLAKLLLECRVEYGKRAPTTAARSRRLMKPP
jgi:hypothetical protein